MPNKNIYLLFYLNASRLFRAGILLLLFANCAPKIQQKTVQQEKDFILIRHGITPWNWRMLAEGPQNLSLNSEGQEHIRRLSETLKTRGIFPAKIISSTLIRCMETTQILKKIMNSEQEPIYTDVLEEKYYGDFSQIKEASEQIVKKYDDQVKGLTLSENEARKQVLIEIQKVGTPSDAEEWSVFKKRIELNIDKILQTEGNGTFIISHGMVIKEFLKYKGLDALADIWLKQGNDRSAVILTCSMDGVVRKAKLVNYK
eukprot:gene3053-3818_t